MSDDTRLGFIGLGRMGYPMATRLTDGSLTVFDHALDAASALVARGAQMASSATHLAELADVVFVRVPGEEQVRSVVAELLLGARPGTTVVVHTTVRPQTAESLAQEAALLGVHLLDAAVSGGPAAAEQGRLALLVGGHEDGFAAARPALEKMGDLVVRLGGPGCGIRGKLARNLVHYVSYAAAGEAARLAEAAGIDPALLGQIVRHSDAVQGGPGAMMWRDTTEPMAPDDPWREVFGRVWTLGDTDLDLAIDLAASLGVQTPLADVARNELGTALGFSESDPEPDTDVS
jgi:3-hydroxyisobutyrate dehydrogenase-like beta-hydroxyacid dehydrogenase